MENKPLKILIVTDVVPYPLTSGGRVCTFNFVDELRTQHNFTLLVPSYSKDDYNLKSTLAKMWSEVDIQLVNINISERNQNQSLLEKTLRFITKKLNDVIQKINPNQVVNHIEKLDYTNPFKPQPLELISKLKDLTTEQKFDIIQVQYTHNLTLIQALPDNCIKIFEHIESQFDVLKDYAKNSNLNSDFIDYLVNNAEHLENFYINKYDAVFTLNQKDCDYLKTNTSFPKIIYSPFGVLTKDFAKEIDFSSTPTKIVFSGGEAHYPNLDALEWYLTQIHSSIENRFGLKLHITGKWSEQTKEHLKKIAPNIIFEGFVDDISSLLKNSIVIVPIRIGGGGLRTKILYAMANGAPVITTEIGAFGIEANNNQLIIANTNTEFINAFEKFLEDSLFREKLTQSAYQLVNEKYSQKTTSQLRNKQYLFLTNNAK